MSKDQYDDAEKAFRKALELQKDDPAVMNYLGYMFADRGIHLDEAESLIQKAVQSDPTNGAYLDSLGWVLFRKGKSSEAREWLEKAVALPDGVDDPAVWDHLGDVQIKLDQPAKAKA